MVKLEELSNDDDYAEITDDILEERGRGAKRRKRRLSFFSSERRGFERDCVSISSRRCAKYGAVASIEIPRPGPPQDADKVPGLLGKIFVEFTDLDDADAALVASRGVVSRARSARLFF